MNGFLCISSISTDINMNNLKLKGSQEFQRSGLASTRGLLVIYPNQTLVIYMGLVGLPTICQNLIGHGLSSETPIAIIEKGTTPQQQVVIGTLNTIEELLTKQNVSAPTIIIIGSVVSLHQKLAWFQA